MALSAISFSCPGTKTVLPASGAANGASVSPYLAVAQSGANAYDMECGSCSTSHSGSSTGSRQIAFDLNPKGLNCTIYGCPSKPNPPYNGELASGGCHSGLGCDDGKRQHHPCPVVASPA